MQLDRVLEILQNRIDQFGVSEPTIQKQGKQRIVIELAGIQDSERARALLQSTALLEFYLVKNPTLTNEIITQLDNDLSNSSLALDMTNSNQSKINEDINNSKVDVVDTSKSTTVSDLFGETSTESDTSLSEDTIKEDALFSSLLVSLQGDLAVKESNLYNLKKLLDRDEVKKRLSASNGQFLLSNDSEILKDVSTSDRFYKLYFLENSAELTGGVVEEARADLGSLGGSSIGQPVVSLTMSSDGSRSWARITGSNIGERIAIVLDNKVHMAPSIREKYLAEEPKLKVLLILRRLKILL